MKEWFGSKAQKSEEAEPQFWWDEDNKVLRRKYPNADEELNSQGAPQPDSEYEVAEQTKYGPVLKRVIRENEVSPRSVAVPNYTDVQKNNYSLPLREPEKIPYQRNEKEVINEEDIPDPGRRGFLKGFGLVVGAAAVGTVAVKAFENSPQQSRPGQVEKHNSDAVEENEQSIESVRFATEITGYETFAELNYHNVLFVDEQNQPIGEPVPLQGFTINRRIQTGEMQSYLVSPGPADELGILTEGIAGEWLAEMRIRLKERNPNLKVDLQNGIPRVLSINNKFKSIVHDSDDTELISEIAAGRVTNYLHIVQHYAQRPFSTAEPYPIREYIEEHIQFKETVPPVVQSELRRIIPGLCAQESNFNNNSLSRSGAQGIFQFMPATWGDYNETTIAEGTQSLEAQVRSAGEFFSDLYRRVQIHAGEEAMRKLLATLDEETIQKDILVPLTINAYNAGAGLIGEAVKRYVETHTIDRKLSGKDIFLAVADFAQQNEEGVLSRYANEAREYVPRIYANSNLIHSQS